MITKEEFDKCPIGQKFIESNSSGRRFAVKISPTHIEKLIIDSIDFDSICIIREFNPNFSGIELVESFKDVFGNEYSFKELKDHYLGREVVD